MLPVSIIGGYLGAGKTTLVNHMLRHADGQRLAVLVNEFGALAIDADLIEAQDDTLISIAGGCVCCSYGDDLVQAIMDLSRLDPPPDHIVIEASGVALPGSIAVSVSLLAGFEISGTLILADAETIRDQAANDYIGDTITRQLQQADLVVLNKTDLVPQAQLDGLSDWLGTAAPQAAIVAARHGRVPNAVLMQSPAVAAKALDASDHGHSAAFKSGILPFSAPGQTHDAEKIARVLASHELGLIRAKGFVPTPSGLRAVQVVGRRWSVSDARAEAQPGLVVIARAQDFDLDKIQRALGLI